MTDVLGNGIAEYKDDLLSSPTLLLDLFLALWERAGVSSGKF